MPIDDPQPEPIGLLVALGISLVSGFISIGRRINRGHAASILWVVTEFASAILAGYLMYQTWPKINGIMPDWFTLPIAVAIAAHTGGRVFQEIEGEFIGKYFDRRKRNLFDKKY